MPGEELVVISGKGGTGKTSVAASFAVLADQPVIADCDVDAADLHLVLSPQIVERHEFVSGHQAAINQSKCLACGLCATNCRFDAIKQISSSNGQVSLFIDALNCEGCGVCVRLCPAQAIEFSERLCGAWMISQTRCGPMVHAQLGIAAENSGKLVTTVRSIAKRIADETNRSLVIIDGPPGIGCAVIASLTGTTRVLVVTEPTVSGEHDLERVLALTKHFNISTAVCVNKWDLNPEMTNLIEKKARCVGAGVVGRIRYDHGVTKAQNEGMAVVEAGASSASDIVQIWRNLNLGGNNNGM